MHRCVYIQHAESISAGGVYMDFRVDDFALYNHPWDPLNRITPLKKLFLILFMSSKTNLMDRIQTPQSE